jgi:hypothetical protein
MMVVGLGTRAAVLAKMVRFIFLIVTQSIQISTYWLNSMATLPGQSPTGSIHHPTNIIIVAFGTTNNPRIVLNEGYLTLGVIYCVRYNVEFLL